MTRIRITVNCVADQYACKPQERIIEFSDPTTRKGGLISFARDDVGNLLVQVYRIDPGVIVKGGAA